MDQILLKMVEEMLDQVYQMALKTQATRKLMRKTWPCLGSNLISKMEMKVMMAYISNSHLPSMALTLMGVKAEE